MNWPWTRYEGYIDDVTDDHLKDLKNRSVTVYFRLPTGATGSIEGRLGHKGGLLERLPWYVAPGSAHISFAVSDVASIDFDRNQITLKGF